MSTTNAVLTSWVTRALRLQIELNVALATIGVLSGCNSVDPDEVIIETAARLESPDEVTWRVVEGVIEEMRRKNDEHLAKVAEAMAVISRVRVVLPEQDDAAQDDTQG
jgi:hypothetical protein